MKNIIKPTDFCRNCCFFLSAQLLSIYQYYKILYLWFQTLGASGVFVKTWNNHSFHNHILQSLFILKLNDLFNYIEVIAELPHVQRPKTTLIRLMTINNYYYCTSSTINRFVFIVSLIWNIQFIIRSWRPLKLM